MILFSLFFYCHCQQNYESINVEITRYLGVNWALKNYLKKSSSNKNNNYSFATVCLIIISVFHLSLLINLLDEWYSYVFSYFTFCLLYNLIFYKSIQEYFFFSEPFQKSWSISKRVCSNTEHFISLTKNSNIFSTTLQLVKRIQ